MYSATSTIFTLVANCSINIIIEDKLIPINSKIIVFDKLSQDRLLNSPNKVAKKIATDFFEDYIVEIKNAYNIVSDFHKIFISCSQIVLLKNGSKYYNCVFLVQSKIDKEIDNQLEILLSEVLLHKWLLKQTE